MNILNEIQIKFIVELALEAGAISMSYFRKPDLKIKSKIDNSLVSEADVETSEFISNGLRSNFPEIKIICEEGDNRDAGDLFWLIDPIDGTSEFIKGSEEFTINIALIKNHKPIFGIIYAPALIDPALYYLNSQGVVIKYLPRLNKEIFIETKKPSLNNYVILTSKKTRDEDLKNYINKFIYSKKVEVIRLSSSLKFCYLLDNKADLYLHFRKSMEWDTGAGQALVSATNRKVIDFEHQELTYQKNDFFNQPFMVR